MSSKAKRRAREERNRPSTFFLVAIITALVILVVAFASYVRRTPGKRPASTTSGVAAVASVA